MHYGTAMCNVSYSATKCTESGASFIRDFEDTGNFVENLCNVVLDFNSSSKSSDCLAFSTD